jgi:hypothetical protein
MNKPTLHRRPIVEVAELGLYLNPNSARSTSLRRGVGQIGVGEASPDLYTGLKPREMLRFLRGDSRTARGLTRVVWEIPFNQAGLTLAEAAGVKGG